MKAFWKERKVLVTGGLGFIGSNLAIRLHELGACVTVVDSLVPEHGGNPHNLKGYQDKIAINISDLRDQNSLNVLVRDREVIFHLAGQVSHGDSMRDPHRDLAVNCIATLNLVEACRHHNPEARLVYTSTRQVYGKPQVLPVTEDHPTIPVDVNGINKLAGEYYHILYHKTYGVRSCVLRLTNTYGPRQQIRNNRQGFIGIMIRQALRGEPIKVFGTGTQIRDFNYVDDVVDALLLAAIPEECFGGIWNLGAPKPYNILDFLGFLSELIPLEYSIVPFPKERGMVDIGDYFGDFQGFHQLTGWTPNTDLKEGLKKTVEWYQQRAKDYWA